MKKGSEIIADFLEEKKIKFVFGIIGAGNAHIFDSIYAKGYTEIICVHHEQVACMAMQTYYRISGCITAAILTTGGGSTNGITGVVSAWADSIPGIIISGNESYINIDKHQSLRMWGIQGYDSTDMVKKVTKYATRVTQLNNLKIELNKVYDIALDKRNGPCWIDVPMNIQSEKINEIDLKKYNKLDFYELDELPKNNIEVKIKNVSNNLKNCNRPLFWFGNGIRLSGAEKLMKEVIENLNIPCILSWAGLDMLDSEHKLVYGRAGVYGQRSSNLILQNCDLLICVGTRLSMSQIGYNINELCREAKINVVDIDNNELLKNKERYDEVICTDAKYFLSQFLNQNKNLNLNNFEWLKYCDEVRNKYPWVSNWEHPDKDGYINSYKFIEKLNLHLKENQILVTDMGTALLSGHQVIKIKEGQRFMTSTGLGEMGYGLPAAIGASFATNKGEVICLNCDGGMMMNLQELQTIAHHNLPIKIFVFNNDGYLMIKHTQNALFNGRKSGVDNQSGVSCPDFSKIAEAFNLPNYKIKTWEDCDKILPKIKNYNGPLICEVFMHPEQLFVPKLSLAIQNDGSLISPPLEDLSPFIPREELEKYMLKGLHEKSKSIKI